MSANSFSWMRSHTLNTKRPLGLSTRRTSAYARPFSGKNIAPNWQTTASKVPSAKGSASVSCSVGKTWRTRSKRLIVKISRTTGWSPHTASVQPCPFDCLEASMSTRRPTLLMYSTPLMSITTRSRPSAHVARWGASAALNCSAVAWSMRPSGKRTTVSAKRLETSSMSMIRGAILSPWTLVAHWDLVPEPATVEQSDLLKQLRIDRGPARVPRRRGRLLAILALLVLAAAVVLLLRVVPLLFPLVQTTAARAAAPRGGGGAG